ncbi:MmcQ/YjbR family DNA-binding protein [Vagococcus sp.]
MIEERMKFLIEVGNKLQFAKVYYREDWDVYYFDILGKQFGLMTKDVTEDGIITLKGHPETNEELRETYEDIVPGYYANKKHWNSIKLNSTAISDSEIEKMIQTSYQLVWDKLPKKVRQEAEKNSK